MSYEDEMMDTSHDPPPIYLRGTCKTCGFAGNDMYWAGDEADLERAKKAIASKHKENPHGSTCECEIEYSTF